MKIKLLSTIFVLALASGNTLARNGETASATITVTSTVPARIFTVYPTDGSNFAGKTATLAYNVGAKKFDEWTLPITAEYAVGFRAKLTAAATIGKDSTTIPLQVKIDEHTLSTTAVSIDTGTDARTQHSLKISSVAQTDHLDTGAYTGSVGLLFEDSI